MAAGNEVSRSSKGPQGDFALVPPWVEREEKARDIELNLNALVDRFAAALKAKLKASEAKYQHGYAWQDKGWQESLIKQLHAHVAKGDPLDVAAYCAFAWHHQWALVNNVNDQSPA